jgi:hypothetical protein
MWRLPGLLRQLLLLGLLPRLLKLSGNVFLSLSLSRKARSKISVMPQTAL